jgi:hypothetical protein
MWVSPNHSPPVDDGELLGRWFRGNREELRVTVRYRHGCPRVSIRVWIRDERTGWWWPVRRAGVEIRLDEVTGVIEALQRAPVDQALRRLPEPVGGPVR